ncbi:hypothetical protein PHYSODRAFT_331631 [Phytophthora sojae]|uniref:F-box domain-containing protein n=1 Tax=Phytophthora sojae (strain P6497) TaxID=1094619 RepID=G4ZIN9_PHYSP|nr:hypothetical protein PHYSODRAFT_331631 [Phytophthora sojae]EGZ17700.1 hypothetical protein PHYSODRAFT_331631 [Phytophthora sojae]|eukprot:XP_009526758.1 hypothetical protein PHYSODRAFT_331631 [Phytophthora sojae]
MRLDDLPESALLNVLSFLHVDVATQLLSNKRRVVYRRGIHDLAAVSTSWASALQAVEGHFRDSILVFDFQQDPDINNEQDECKDTTTDEALKSTAAANDAAPGGIFQFVRELLSAFTCASNSATNRLSRRPSEEGEESHELMLQNRKKLQVQRKAKHVDNELKRLLQEVTAGRHPRRRVELWLNDPHDVTVYDVDDICGEDVLQYWRNVFSNCKYLVRLDLSGVPLESDHLPGIMSAVGEHCVNLEELILRHDHGWASEVA